MEHFLRRTLVLSQPDHQSGRPYTITVCAFLLTIDKKNVQVSDTTGDTTGNAACTIKLLQHYFINRNHYDKFRPVLRSLTERLAYSVNQGKCCVSMHSAACWLIAFPSLLVEFPVEEITGVN